MRQLLARVWLGLRITAFVLLCVTALPVFLLQMATGRLQDWIEARWPESSTAQVFAFWLKLLAPVTVMLGLFVAILLAIAWVLAQTPVESSPPMP
jgi:hypothetical protein